MRRTISIVLIGTLSLPALAHDKSYEHEHVRIPQTSTENTGEPPKVIPRKSILQARSDAEKEAEEFNLSVPGTYAAMGVGLATGVVGMAFLVGFTQPESVSIQTILAQKNESDEYRIVFADTFKKKTKAKKRLQRFTASLAGALVGIALYVNNR